MSCLFSKERLEWEARERKVHQEWRDKKFAQFGESGDAWILVHLVTHEFPGHGGGSIHSAYELVCNRVGWGELGAPCNILFQSREDAELGAKQFGGMPVPFRFVVPVFDEGEG